MIGEPTLKKTLPANGDKPAMNIWVMTLANADGRQMQGVELMAKETSPKPSGTLTGTVDTSGQYGPKFKKDKPAFGGRGGGGRSPQENARITRQHSQEMGLRFVAAQAAAGQLPEGNVTTEYLRGVIDWFDRDAWVGSVNPQGSENPTFNR